MKNVLIILILSFILSGCGVSDHNDDINRIMKENEYIIVDVRTKDEYETGHVAGAINIPYEQIENNNDLDKDKVIFVYCQSGKRSRIAFDVLTNLGYTVYDLGSFSNIYLPKE